jgi:hypothetical protein
MKAKRFQEKTCEHMEALNHIEAIALSKNMIDKNLALN